jgi:predicted AAA+ superfamily ATPase
LAFDLLDAVVFRDLSANPENLRKIVQAHPNNSTVVIDEIQRIPELLPVVHALIVEYPQLRFVLTGSSARKLKRQGVDLLAGRALLNHLHPLTAHELGSSFDITRALTNGLVPLVALDANAHQRLDAYISLYLQEEVNYEGLTRNIGAFNRFLRFAALSHGSLLNISSLARDCQIERKVVENYITILEDLLIARRIYPFEKRARRKIVHHPKFYLFDSGVFDTLRPKGPLDSPQGIEGAALEGLVEHHLRAWIDYSGSRAQCFYWRTPAGTEVDFVVYGESTFHAIEVKRSTRVRPEDLRALHTFIKDYPEAKGVLVYMGQHRIQDGPISCIPCDQFLSAIRPDSPLPE